MAVGKHHISFRGAADADVVLDRVIERRHFLIRNGPVVSIAVMASCFEVEITQTITLPSPAQRSSPENAQALPTERLAGRCAVGIFKVIDKPVVVVFGAGVALCLDGACLTPFTRTGVVTISQLKNRIGLGELGL